MPYLTKSRFKIATECITQLYYHDDNRYANQSLDDNFLKELARGGFQVGALAQCYFPGGIFVDTLDHQQAFERTLELLKHEDVIIFEAAFLYKNCFIRADILIKRGNQIELIEVKAKSISPSTNNFYNREEIISSAWRPYLYDIAFQAWVTNRSLEVEGLSSLIVTPFLMLANKEEHASVEGLNQRFFYNKNTRKVEFENHLTTPEALGEELLVRINVSKEVQHLYEQMIEEHTFVDFVNQCSDAVAKHTLIYNGIGVKCKSCGFTTSGEDLHDGKLNGSHECLKAQAGFTDGDFERAMAWDIWDARKKENWINKRKYFMDQIFPDDLGDDKGSDRGFSRVTRQDLQRTKTINKDYTPEINIPALRQYFSEWQYPFHCIDFETTTVALPFHKGMRPYEQIAFQFSHHMIHEDGKVVHQTEWIYTEPGRFPNFEFVRALKKALEPEGTIFRYAAHENTVLCQIHTQLSNSSESDKKELQEFIESITTKKVGNKILWDGARTMVDLCKVVKDCYYSLYAGGSNSIKAILPAILNSSEYLQKVYSAPIYGTEGMPSKNFHAHTWVSESNELVNDPYSTLAPIFSKADDALLDKLLMDEDAELADGGAAMAAYGMMQFTHMTVSERVRVREALLRYCELDTLAMVMVVEEFGRVVN